MISRDLAKRQPRNHVAGELIVRYPDTDEFGDILNDGGCVKTIVFACPTVITAHELRQRINGTLKIFARKNAGLFFEGTKLDGEDVRLYL